MILVFLQNAYGVEKGYVPDYDRDSFRACYTGKRLKEMLPVDSVVIRNCTPDIGDTADSFLAPDLGYMERMIAEIKPTVVLGCGKETRKALNKIAPEVPIVFAPHPAWRQLSKEKTGEIREHIYQLLGGD